MTKVATSSTLDINGRFRVRVWDVNELERADPEWSSRSHAARHDLLKDPSRFPTAPAEEFVETNMPVDGFLEQLAVGLDPSTNTSTKASHLALGDDATAPTASNTSLNNEIYRTIVGDAEPDARDLLTSTFISQSEMNGENIREIGLTTGSVADGGALLTHAALSTTDQIEGKTSSMAITFDYVIEFRRVS